MQIQKTKIILFGGFDCVYSCFGIWLVYLFSRDVDGYLSVSGESYEAIHLNPEVTPISIMEYNENMAKTRLRWT